MSEKIYFGPVDLIDTRTGEIIRIENVMFRESAPLSDICDRAISKMPRSGRIHYQVKRVHIDRAKIIGETV